MNINEKLFQLYSETNERIYKDITDKNKQLGNMNVSYPFFPYTLKLSEKFINAKNKIIIYGQARYGYHDKFGEETYTMLESGIKETLVAYNDLYHVIGYRDIDYKYPPLYLYRNAFKLVEDYLCEYIQSIDYEKKFYLLWNIAEMGLNRKVFPKNWYDATIKPYLNELLRKELEITEPDFVIFFLGTTRYHILDEVFNNPVKININNYPTDELCEILIPNIKKAFRVSHPKVYHRGSSNSSYREKIITITNKIIGEMI